MPYTVGSPPDRIKGLPKHAQEIWISAYNSAYEGYDPKKAKAESREAYANSVAWAAVKQKYEQRDGKWMLKEATSEEEHEEMKEADQGEREKAKDAQKARAKKYGIAIREDGNVTKPSEWASVPDEQWGDPVNYSYPCPDAKQTQAALRYWGKGKNKAKYSSEDQATITARLNKFAKKFKVGEFREGEPYRLVEAISMEGVEPQDVEGKEWVATLIRAGWGKPSGVPPVPKRYDDNVIKEALPLFEGLPLFKNHATDAELKERPERRIEEKAGWYEKPFYEDGKAKAHMMVVDPWLRSVLLEAHKMGNPDFIQLSIDGDGIVSPLREGEHDGLNVEAITKMYSVDAVTSGAAGGEVERLIASATKEKGGDMDKEKENEGKDTQEAPLDEGAIEALIEKRITESVDQRLQILESQATLREALAAASLPEKAKERLMETLRGKVLKQEEIDEAIKKEQEYVDSFKVARVVGAGFVKDGVKISQDEADKLGKALLGLFDPQMKPVDDVPPFTSLHEAFRRFTGVHFEEVEFGMSTPIAVPYKPTYVVDRRRKGKLVEAASIRLREATEYTTSTWADVFGDVMYKALMKEFRLDYLQDWRKIVSDIESARDFMTRHEVIRGGIEALSSVSQGAAYAAQSNPAGDEEIEWAVAKKGNKFTFTWEMFINDSIGAMRRQIRAMGRGAAQTLHQAVFNLIANGFATTSPDYTSEYLFSTAHASGSNKGTSALSYSAVVAATAAMRTQLAYHDGTNDWEPLGNAVAPRWLVVPNELEELAFQICRNTKRPNTAENDLNLFRERGLDYIVADYWTDANNWFLVSDPAAYPTIVVGFLRGRQEPEIFVQDMETVGSMFDSDEITYKLRFIYGTDVMRHEGMYGSDVT